MRGVSEFEAVRRYSLCKAGGPRARGRQWRRCFHVKRNLWPWLKLRSWRLYWRRKSAYYDGHPQLNDVRKTRFEFSGEIYPETQKQHEWWRSYVEMRQHFSKINQELNRGKWRSSESDHKSMKEKNLFFQIKLEVKRRKLIMGLPSSNEAAELRADYFVIFRRVFVVHRQLRNRFRRDSWYETELWKIFWKKTITRKACAIE